MRILVAEDEVRLGQALVRLLTEEGYGADRVETGTDALEYALSGQYDLMILDVMLPGMSGLEVARSLRRQGRALPILMLTARDEIADKVAGLDSGADDYMTKPFSHDELRARVRALTRRQGDWKPDEYEWNGLVLGLDSRKLICGARSVRLSYKEFGVMDLLMSKPGLVVPKEEMILRVWGAESEAEDNNVEVYISFLRKKLAFLGSAVTIGTARKVGYYLEVTGHGG